MGGSGRGEVGDGRWEVDVDLTSKTPPCLFFLPSLPPAFHLTHSELNPPRSLALSFPVDSFFLLP